MGVVHRLLNQDQWTESVESSQVKEAGRKKLGGSIIDQTLKSHSETRYVQRARNHPGTCNETKLDSRWFKTEQGRHGMRGLCQVNKLLPRSTIAQTPQWRCLMSSHKHGSLGAIHISMLRVIPCDDHPAAEAEYSRDIFYAHRQWELEM